MARKTYRNVVVGLDIGSNKVASAAGEITFDGAVNVLGICNVPSTGLRRGNVIDLEDTAHAIDDCLNELERLCGINIASARIGFSGAGISSLSNRAVVAVGNPGEEIRSEDVERVMHAAKMVPIPADRSIIQMLPRQFIVDGYDGVADAVGMAGSRLEVETTLITASHTAVQNLIKSVVRTGLQIKDLNPNALLTGESVLTPAEKEMGVVLVDIGGGTTDISIYERGTLAFNSTLPVGGEHITRDLAVGLRTTVEGANRIKEQHGCVNIESEESKEIEVTSMHGQEVRSVSLQVIASIIQPRVQEILELVQSELFRAGLIGIPPGGMVLTGGTSNLGGITRLVEEYLHIPARSGVPENVSVVTDDFKKAQYAAVIGALLYDSKTATSDVSLEQELMDSWLGRIILWFKDLFR